VVRLPDTPSTPGERASCEVSELGTTVQITARGELDVAALPALRTAARGVDLSPGGVVVLDLCRATLVDTAVVEFVLGLHARATDRGCSLVVVVRPNVRTLIARAGAEGVTIVEDASEPGG
jgi:anti-anti-sigma regulatory factor